MYLFKKPGDLASKKLLIPISTSQIMNHIKITNFDFLQVVLHKYLSIIIVQKIFADFLNDFRVH